MLETAYSVLQTSPEHGGIFEQVRLDQSQSTYNMNNQVIYDAQCSDALHELQVFVFQLGNDQDKGMYRLTYGESIREDHDPLKRRV